MARAVAALTVLQRTPVGGSVEHLDSSRRQARCRTEARVRMVIGLEGRPHFVFVVGTLARTAGRRQLPVRRWAEIQLAGCRALMADELASSLLDTHRTIGAVGTFHRRRVVRLTISRFRGRTMLLVSPTTLVPLAVQFRSGRVHGWSSLILRPRPVRRPPPGALDLLSALHAPR